MLYRLQLEINYKETYWEMVQTCWYLFCFYLEVTSLLSCPAYLKLKAQKFTLRYSVFCFKTVKALKDQE